MKYLDEKSKFKAAQLEMSHKALKGEWDRIKDENDDKGKPRLFDDLSRGMSTMKRCSLVACTNPITEPVKLCSACRMAIYCSPVCAKKSWWGHKYACAAAKRDVEDTPRYKAIVAQFPWTQRGFDTVGLFHTEYILVQYGLLGTDRNEVGYWTTNVRGSEQLGSEEALVAPWRKLTEEKGWRLPRDQIPSLERLHEPGAVCPKYPPAFEDSWISYYKWRGLPIASLAALLLHWPLAVYACLKALGIAPVSESGPRKRLTVFYLGARDEITFIPVFGELALLFPNTDLDLVMFGPSVSMAVRRNSSRTTRPCVYSYTSPAACGGGTLRVLLDSSQEYYRPSRAPDSHPDAIVALNAGLGTYISWHHVIFLAAEFGIPFAVTDFNGNCIYQVRMDVMEQALSEAGLPQPKSSEQAELYGVVQRVLKEVRLVDLEKTAAALREAKNRPATLNAFMDPALRRTPTGLSLGAGNGCVWVVIPGREPC